MADLAKTSGSNQNGLWVDCAGVGHHIINPTFTDLAFSPLLTRQLTLTRQLALIRQLTLTRQLALLNTNQRTSVKPMITAGYVATPTELASAQ